MAAKLKTHEVRKILKLGESIREHPKGLLLSIPIFGLGIIFYSLIRDKEGVAGSYGHMSLAFKNYHRLYWQATWLLKVAYWLLDRAAANAVGEGKISTILHCGTTAKELHNYSLAETKFNQALKLARQSSKNRPQIGYILSHLGLFHLNQQKFSQAYKELSQAMKILQIAAKRKPDSLHIQVWASQAELSMSEYYLATGDKPKANQFAKQAQKRSLKYNLKIRQQDATKLLKRISAHQNNLLVAVSMVEFSLARLN